MANKKNKSVMNFIQDNYVSVFLVLTVFILFIELPKTIIDIVMILNLAFSFIVFLAVINTPRASDFQTYPRVILFQALFGLAINISSTRLILGSEVTSDYSNQQSAMVQAFADVVAGNDVVLGFIIFIILIIVQVLVITKGASRVSEVSARFTLDSMSSKFFDIDNRFNSGVIDENEALRLKDAIRKEIDFYSNMDGASKFVSGNVKAGILITLVNLIGGIFFGMANYDLSFNEALNSYSKLTIGDGLMSQLPSLIISFSTGILVTGSKSDESLSEQLKMDFTRSGYVYIIVGLTLAIFGIGLRHGTQILLIPIGILFVFVGLRLSRTKEKEAQKKEEEIKAQQGSEIQKAASNESDSISLLDPLSLELGYALIPLVNQEKGAELLERITRIRNEAKLDMGFVIPKIRIVDNMTLEPNDYVFKIKGIERGRASIRLGYYMCMDTGSVVNPIQGEETKDPAFGMNAIWLPEDKRQEAEEAGYVTVDPPTIIATHLTEIIRANASQMLGRQEVSAILDTVKEKNPVLVKEVLETAQLTIGVIEKVLQNLLDENVSIRNIITILETLANFAHISKNPWDLTAKVREALGLQICLQYVDSADKKLRVMRLSETFTQMIADHAHFPADGSKPIVAFDNVDYRSWMASVSDSFARVTNQGYQPIILCVSSVRQLVKSSLDREMPGIIVLSDMEILAAGRNIVTEIVDEIELKEEAN